MASWKKLLTEGNVQASDVASGTLGSDRIPNLSANKITSDAFNVARIPSLPASKITSGELGTARIPNLSANKITSDAFNVERIPSLPASKITTGTLGTARIPNLSANKITSDQLNTARIPSLPTSKITSGTFVVARIPDLSATKITSGTLPVARGGTGQTSGYNKSNWDTAYGWGDHSAAGYLTSETDSQTLSFSSGTLTISNGNSVTIPDTNTDTNTQNTYSVSIPTSTTKLRLSGAGHDGNTTDDIEFVGSGATTVTRTTASKFTISSTNTTYSVQDGELSQNNFTDADHTKLDGIAELANRYALSSASFNTTTGVLSIGGNASDSVTVDLDGRYLTSETDSQTLSVSGTSLSISNGNSVTVPTGSWTLASASADNGNAITNGQKVIIAGGTGITSTRSTKTITLALSSGAALANLGGGSGSNYLRQDGTWANPDTDTNTTYTLSAYDNAPASGITVTPSSGSAYNIEFVDGDLSYSTSGNEITASIQNNVISAAELNVSGNGSSGQFLRSDGDGSFTWATPTDTNTTYSVATSSTAGLVKIGYTESGQNYPVELSSGKMFVNVPWTDNDTTYSVGDGGLTQKNFTTTLKTKLDGIATSADNYGSWTLNAGNTGSVGSTAVVTIQGSGDTSVSQAYSGGNHTITISSTDTNTTYSAGTGLSLSGTTFSLSSGAALSNLGGGSGTTFLRKDGTFATPTNTTYSAGTGLFLGGGYFSIADSGVTNQKIANDTIQESKLDISNAGFSGGVLAYIPAEGGFSWQNVSPTHLAGSPGNGSSGQVLQSDGDGTFSWATAPTDTYIMSWTAQVTLLKNRLYCPSKSYGANAESWSSYVTSMPTRIGYTSTWGSFWCMPIVIPKTGVIKKWGFKGAGNSSTIGNLEITVKHGTMSNGAQYSGVLSTVGSATTVNVASSGRYYEWKQSSLSHSVAEDDVLCPFFELQGSTTSTRYLRGSFYLVIEPT